MDAGLTVRSPVVVPAPPEDRAVVIASGECWIYLAFDVGNSVDLEAARLLLGAPPGSRRPMPSPHGVPGGLQFRPEPLRVSEPSEPVSIGPWRTRDALQVAVFDFGAVSLAYRVDLVEVGWPDLQALAQALDDDRSLHAQARRTIEGLMARCAPAVNRLHIADTVEDYAVFRAHTWLPGRPPGPAADLVKEHAASIAQVLRASLTPLSEYEAGDALSCALGFGPADLTIIDWKAALVFDPDPSDILAVLEFANVELMEMRFLDDRLDGILDRSYQTIVRRRVGRFFPGRAADERRRIAVLQMENALLFEGINNAIKLVGDQYLSRVYREATRRFHLAEWDASVLRKLDTLQRAYEKLADEHATRRMELLEWIIIILIAVSILIPFLPGAAK